LADNSELSVIGSGTISLRTASTQISDSDVNYIPQLQGNYFSVRQAENNGIKCLFGDNRVVLYTALGKRMRLAILLQLSSHFPIKSGNRKVASERDELTLSAAASSCSFQVKSGNRKIIRAPGPI